MFKYITDWACPIKRMFYGSLSDFGISTYDILVFIHFNTIVAEYGAVVAFCSAFLGCILTLLKIVQLIMTWSQWKKPR